MITRLFLAMLCIIIVISSCIDGPTYISKVRSETKFINIYITKGSMGSDEINGIFIVDTNGVILNQYNGFIAKIELNSVYYDGNVFSILQCGLNPAQQWESNMISDQLLSSLYYSNKIPVTDSKIIIPIDKLNQRVISALKSKSCGIVLVVGNKLFSTKEEYYYTTACYSIL